ncbi:unnamed protein product [Pieris brassicae]|uniref:Uncharacterized protein n=1 Tax=Pieris brassicae TaxID=7116 RepID=A0A9P0XI71_PIEBR|nr:unnamed protein product [Pieris brassicae]
MMKISWTEKRTNEETIPNPGYGRRKRNLSTIENRRGKMIGHLVRHDNLFKTILEGKIEDRTGRGRPRAAYIDQIKEKAEVVTYQEVKTLTQNRTD